MYIMKYDWKDAENDTHYYYKTETGLIVAQTHKIAHTKIYLAVILLANQEKFLGRFVSLDFAKRSIEHYWDVQSRTLLESEL